MTPASKLGLVTLVLICIATWELGHSYLGIVHDARLYTLQALAHVVPGSLGHDIFLQFGSQDRYTIFSPIYAEIIKLFGVEPAAAVITLVSQLSLMFAAWLLARALVPAHRALLALAILIAIPGEYGPDKILRIMENFATPRLLSEALGLAALAAALTRRTWLSIACIAGAAVLHPIMAAGAAVAAFCLYVAIPHPRLAAVLAACAVLALVAGALLFPVGILRCFDTAWLDLVKERDPYVFTTYWRMDDWVRATVPLATLAAGWRTLPVSRARVLSQAVLITGVAGLALNLLACDQLHLVLLTQLQPWRWEWLAVAVGALILPLVVWNYWQMGDCGRAFALLLICAWVFGSNAAALLSIAAATAALMLARRLKPREARLVFIGACAALVLALVWRFAFDLLSSGDLVRDPSVPARLGWVMTLTHAGAVPIAVALLALWLAQHPRGELGRVLLAAVLLATCAVLAPTTWNRWSYRQYAWGVQAMFLPWRRIIPPGTEVFWPASPVGTWLLLERPAYLSAVQTSGMLFSRKAAVEMKRRAVALSAVVPETAFLSWESARAPSLELTAHQMELICRSSEVPFVVTSADLHLRPVAILPGSAWPVTHGLKLYGCSERSG